MSTETKETQDVLDQLMARDPMQRTVSALGLLLWKGRYTNPEMAVQITAQDIAEYEACTEYLGVTPRVNILRPQGRPAQPAQPATAKRSAIPATPGEPPRPYVLVCLVDHTTGDGFKPIESTEEGAKIRDQHDALRRHRDRAPHLAAQLLAELQSGMFTDGTMRDAAATLTALAKAGA